MKFNHPNWKEADWSRSNVELAMSLGVTTQAVRINRRKLGGEHQITGNKNHPWRRSNDTLFPRRKAK